MTNKESEKKEHKSDCCGAPVRIVDGAGDFHDNERGITMGWECTKCGESCSDTFYTTPEESTIA